LTAAIRDATLLSLRAAAITAGIATLFRVPLACLLARRSFLCRCLVEAVVDLPLVVPQ
jgi:ABC-type sulfate transport system permease component